MVSLEARILTLGQLRVHGSQGDALVVRRGDRLTFIAPGRYGRTVSSKASTESYATSCSTGNCSKA